MRGRPAYTCLGAAALWFGGWMHAGEPPKPAAPRLDQFYPIVVAAGSTSTVAAAGKFTPWPPRVWSEAGGIVFHPDEKEGRFRLEIGADVPPGPHLVRAYNEQGASALRFVIVAPMADALETEPNDDYAKAPAITSLPTTIGGRLDKSGDVDSFPVQLEAGQTLVAALEAYVLASPVDAVLRLVDANGGELALNHDNGRTPDPLLTWTAKASGTYVVQVFGFAHPATAEVNFTGNDACVYRLHLTRGPHARHTLPLGAQRGQPTMLRVHGWNLGASEGQALRFEPSTLPPDATHASWQHEAFANVLQLPLGDGPELIAPGLDPERREWTARAAPFAVTGRLAQAGAKDEFAFTAEKGERLGFEIQSAALGFPLDAWLAIQNAGGKELARNDDGATADPFLEWTAPETGTFRAVVGSVLHRGSPDYLYRLSVAPARPHLRAVIAASSITIAPGKTEKIKITIARQQGFKAKLVASVAGLPEGVSAASAEAGETAKEIEFELQASADAAAFNGPITLQLAEPDAGPVHRVRHDLTAVTSNNGVPQGFRDLLIRSTERVWLTVLPAPPAKPNEPPTEN